MEPMTLGSPVRSPMQTPGSPGSNSAYLPSFLLGETTTPARLGMANTADTPRYSTNLSSPISNYSTPDYRQNRQKAVYTSPTSPGNPRMPANHAGGPPIKDLFDTLEIPQESESFSVSMNRSLSRNQPRNTVNSMSDPVFLDNSVPMGNNEPSQGLLRWITVFGFPPDALNMVLFYISNRVRVVDKRMAPHPQSNWIHLKCATEQEAQRALMCNGHIVTGLIMIGVMYCMDEGVVLSPENKAQNMNGSMRILSPAKFNQTSESGNNSIRSPRIPNLRPLAPGYQHFSPQAVKSPENLPQKSTGVVAKAMELVFGW